MKNNYSEINFDKQRKIYNILTGVDKQRKPNEATVESSIDQPTPEQEDFSLT